MKIQNSVIQMKILSSVSYLVDNFSDNVDELKPNFERVVFELFNLMCQLRKVFKVRDLKDKTL